MKFLTVELRYHNCVKKKQRKYCVILNVVCVGFQHFDADVMLGMFGIFVSY